MIVQDQKHAWKISIQNRNSQKLYHQFLIPNEILGEDLSIRSCMSSEQRDINMGYKEYSNSNKFLESGYIEKYFKNDFSDLDKTYFKNILSLKLFVVVNP